jgi:hypothetical protein
VLAQVGRVLLVFGTLLLAGGAILVLMDRFGLGRLPGDVVLSGRRVTIYFPIATSILLSILLTIVLDLWLRRR